MADDPQTLSLGEAAAFLKTTATRVDECIQRRGLPAARVGGSWVLVDADVIAWLRKQYGAPDLDDSLASGRRQRSTPAVPPPQNRGDGESLPKLMGTADIARMLGVTQKHATDKVVTKPDFPAPACRLSQKSRLWQRDDVLEHLKPKPSRRR